GAREPLASFASGHPQQPFRTAVARPHHPVPDGAGSQRIVCAGSRHHGRQSARAPSGNRPQRRAGPGGYLARRMSSRAGGGADSPICAEARERLPIPASALRQGDNELRITAVDDVADENGDSQINWDAPALLRTSQAAADPAISVAPAYLFVTENGATREIVT